MITLFWAAAVALLLMAFVCLWRADVGPSIQDRILAVNVVGVKALVVLALLGVIRGHAFLIDVALVYGLLNFIITIAATRLIETGRFRSGAPP